MNRDAGGLQLEQDLKAQYRTWSVQRGGWVVMILLVGAALAGIFGDGPLSHTEVNVGKNLSLRYERFARVENQTPLHLSIQHPGQKVKVVLSRDYADDVQLQTVTPQPDRMDASPAGLTLIFKPEHVGPLLVKLFVEPERAGLGRGQLRVDGVSVPFQQLFWP